MNALLLLLIAIPVLAFGYRFYAKLLALGVFGLDQNNYSTPARTPAEAYEQVPTPRHFLFGHHSAALAGLTVVGVGIALAWGWVPALLWIVAGTAVGAGPQLMGGLWLSLREPGAGPYRLSQSLIGRHAAFVLFVVGFVLLLGLNLFAGGVAASLLTMYPTAALPLVFMTLVAAGLGFYLHGRRQSALWPASLAALSLVLLATVGLSHAPLSFTGVLQFEARALTLLTIDGFAVWMTLLLVYSFFAARAPVWQLSRPCSYLTALLAVVVLLLWLSALLLVSPPIAAPEFHRTADAPPLFPWLFVALAGGTLAGFQMLLANGVTAKQMKREGHTRYIGYGGAVVDGLVALVALLIGITAVADTTAWRELYSAWPAVLDLPRVLRLLVDGGAGQLQALGLAPALARTLLALVLIGLSLATLEAGVRVLKHLLLEVSQPAAGAGDGQQRLTERRGLHLAFWLSLLLALTLGRELSSHWLLFGTVNLLYAGLALLLLALALHRQRRPALLLWLPAAFALGMASWALLLMLRDDYRTGRWLSAGLALLLVVATGVILAQAANRLRTSATQPSALPPS